TERESPDCNTNDRAPPGVFYKAADRCTNGQRLAAGGFPLSGPDRDEPRLCTERNPDLELRPGSFGHLCLDAADPNAITADGGEESAAVDRNRITSQCSRRLDAGNGRSARSRAVGNFDLDEIRGHSANARI